MHAQRFLISGVITLTLAATAFAQATSVPWKLLANEPEWPFTDPAYLYLTFEDKNNPAVTLTWLHPNYHRSNWCEEVFMPGHVTEARAFSFRLSRETPEGYEITFQPIEPAKPWKKRPLPLKAIKAFFPRSEQRRFALSEKLAVSGFYGDPQFRPAQ